MAFKLFRKKKKSKKANIITATKKVIDVQGINGWIIPYLAKAVEESRVVIPLTKGRIMVGTGPLRLAHKSVQDAVEACKIAAAGSSTKVVVPTQAPAAPGDLTANIQTQVFGALVRISDSFNQHGLNVMKVEMGFKAGTGDSGVDDAVFYVGGYSNIFEFIALSVSNNAGVGQIKTSQRVNIKIASGSGIRAEGTWISLESLNLRDLQGLLATMRV